jgi:hypothetical protein
MFLFIIWIFSSLFYLPIFLKDELKYRDLVLKDLIYIPGLFLLAGPFIWLYEIDWNHVVVKRSKDGSGF